MSQKNNHQTKKQNLQQLELFLDNSFTESHEEDGEVQKSDTKVISFREYIKRTNELAFIEIARTGKSF